MLDPLLIFPASTQIDYPTPLFLPLTFSLIFVPVEYVKNAFQTESFRLQFFLFILD